MTASAPVSKRRFTTPAPLPPLRLRRAVHAISRSIAEGVSWLALFVLTAAYLLVTR